MSLLNFHVNVTDINTELLKIKGERFIRGMKAKSKMCSKAIQGFYMDKSMFRYVISVIFNHFYANMTIIN